MAGESIKDVAEFMEDTQKAVREITKLKILIMIIASIALIDIFGGNKNSSKTTSDNYGQYDKGTATCDKGACGDITGLCK